MRMMDLYYQAFKAFRKHTEQDVNSQKLRKVIAHSGQQADLLTSVKFTCDIKEEWINNIEEGLIYVEKAIREDRQFIRTEGEVVPIEKVKKVSKASVEHLSRHSDLITRAPESLEKIIPDKLYVVEKLSDYLVYENRFLYMLLCYLKDFIQMRIDKIRDKTTTYVSTMQIDKVVEANQRHLTYKLDYEDIYKNDPFLTDVYHQIPLVDRVETMYAMVVSFLAMPLMKEVSKAPMIKPPVVKTNVLRMNQNFRASLKLYDFVTSYSEDGYTFREIKKTFKPLPSDMADEIADTAQLTSVIAYIKGNDISALLEQRLNEKELALKAIEDKKIQEELKRLKKRIVELNEDPFEYMLKLEKRNLKLEKDGAQLTKELEANALLRQTIDQLNVTLKQLEKTNEELSQKMSDMTDEIILLNQKYYDDMLEQADLHQTELSQLDQVHQSNILDLNSQHQIEINQIHEKTESKIKSIEASHQEEKRQKDQAHKVEVSRLTEQYQHMSNQLEEKNKGFMAEIDLLNAQIRDLNLSQEETIKEFKLAISNLESEIKALDEQRLYANAQYTALKKQQGLLSEDEDFTSKERFKQLELEMLAYKKLFKSEWKRTKSKIKATLKQEMPIVPKKETNSKQKED